MPGTFTKRTENQQAVLWACAVVLRISLFPYGSEVAAQMGPDDGCMSFRSVAPRLMRVYKNVRDLFIDCLSGQDRRTISAMLMAACWLKNDPRRCELRSTASTVAALPGIASQLVMQLDKPVGRQVPLISFAHKSLLPVLAAASAGFGRHRPRRDPRYNLKQ